jgi:hypothetical protein
MDIFTSGKYTIVDISIDNGNIMFSNETNTDFIANALTRFEERIIKNLNLSPYIKFKGLNFLCIGFEKNPEYCILFQNCSSLYMNSTNMRLKSLENIYLFEDVNR